MLKIKYSYIVIFLSVNLMYSQIDTITGDAFNDLSKILVEGIIDVDIMDSYTNNPRFNELSLKIMNVIDDNPKWLKKYTKKIKGYDPLYYDSRFGLTEEEFTEYLELESKQGLESSGKEKLQISYNKESNIITFQGNEKLKLLNHIKINLTDKKVKYKIHELNNFENFSFEKRGSTLRSDGRVYSWKITTQDFVLDNSGNEFVEIYEVIFQISQLKENGKILMSVDEKIYTKVAHASEFNELYIMF